MYAKSKRVRWRQNDLEENKQRQVIAFQLLFYGNENFKILLRTIDALTRYLSSTLGLPYQNAVWFDAAQLEPSPRASPIGLQCATVPRVAHPWLRFRATMMMITMLPIIAPYQAGPAPRRAATATRIAIISCS